MKLIHLANCALTVKVDDEDYPRVSKHSWCLLRGGGNRQKRYAQANVKVHGVWKRVCMHRFILGVYDTRKVDHRDNDGLNNQRENLRFATRGQNQHNSGRRMYKGKRTSKFKGVHLSNKNRWIAQICRDGKRQYIGSFSTEEQAARAYDRKAKQLHGEYAMPNFP